MWDKESIIAANRKNIVKFTCTENSPLVSIIIVNHNGEGHLRRLFASLQSASFYPKYEMIVVEQASTDGSQAVLDKYKDILPLRIFQNECNESFSVASNKGARLAQGEYLLLLNNDTEVTDGWLDALLDTAVKDNVGAVGARLIYPEMPAGSVNAGKSWTLQHSGVLWKIQFAGKKTYYIPYHVKNGDNPIQDDVSPRRYGVVTGACLLVKKELYWKAGGLDENYQYGYEDVDLCLKLYRLGYDNYCCPAALLFHYEFGTQCRDEAKARNARRTRNRDYLNIRWSNWLEKQILQDKIEKTGVFSELSLKVIIITNKNSSSNQLAKKLHNELILSGYISFVINLDDKAAYQPGADVDVIISLEPDYNPLRIEGTPPSVLTLAWCNDRLEQWCRNEALHFFNYMLVSERNFCDYFYDRIGRMPIFFGGSSEELLSTLRARNSQDENKVLILSPATDEERGKTWGDHHFANDLALGFQKHGYETEVRTFDKWELPFAGKFVISIRGSILPKTFHPKMEYVNIIWNISHPEVLSPEYYDEFDMIYVASRSYAEKLQKSLKMPVAALMQCTSLEKFHQAEAIEHHELLFIGDSLGRFRQTIKDLLPTRYEFSLYGRGWEKYISKEYIKGQYVANEELKNYYGSCDILLNDHWPEMREKGFLSNRLFDGLAAGAFIITDAVEGLEEELPEGVVSYDGTREDLQEKIEYWLRHKVRRRRSAEKGRKLVESKHTFFHRAGEMIRFMKKVRLR